MAFIFVQQFGDGFVGGDRCRIGIDCGPDTSVHVTTQAATNLYRTEQSFAKQCVNLSAGPGAILEYLPDATVPFRGSRFSQRTCLSVDPTATAIVGELLLPGRVARGELHAYEHFRAEFEARRPDGALLFADLLRLEPADGEGLRSLGRLAEVGTLVERDLLRNGWRDALAGLRDEDLVGAAAALREVGDLPHEAAVLLLAASDLVEAGRRGEAEQQLALALDFFRSVGATRYVERAEAVLSTTA